MKTFRFFGSFAVTVLLVPAATSFGQDRVKQATVQLNFGDVTLVTPTSADQPSIKIIPTEFVRETRTRVVPVTKMRAERRTRTAIVDGKQVEQTYTVNIPYTERVEQTYNVQVPLAGKPAAVPIKALLAWDCDGNPVSNERLVKQLAEPVHVFLLKSRWPVGSAIEASHRAVLRDDTLFIYKPNSSSPQE